MRRSIRPFSDAEALLLSRLERRTLAALSADFHARLARAAARPHVEHRHASSLRRPACMSELLDPFSDPADVARYTEGPRRFVPGFADLHTHDRHPARRARAGGCARSRAWRRRRTRVEGAGGCPSRLDIRRRRSVAGNARRSHDARSERICRACELHEGLIDDAPDGPFDAATCLLTLHFLPADERRRTASEIRRRLKPGAPFVAAHSSFPQDRRRARAMAVALCRFRDRVGRRSRADG